MKNIPLSNIKVSEVKTNGPRDSGRYSWGDDDIRIDSVKVLKMAYHSYQAHKLAAEALGFGSPEEMDIAFRNWRDFD